MKKILTLILAAMLILSFCACSSNVNEQSEDEDTQQADVIANEDEANEDEADSDSAKKPDDIKITPTPEPTQDPDMLKALEDRGFEMPEIEGKIVYDYEEIAKLLPGAWTSAYFSQGDITKGDSLIYYFSEDGEFRYYDATFNELWYSGEWEYADDDISLLYYSDGAPRYNEFIVVVTKGQPVLYHNDGFGVIQFVRSTLEEEGIVRSSSEDTKYLKSVLCSASWLAAGSYDTNNKYDSSGQDHKLTFFDNGYVVKTKGSENIVGNYAIDSYGLYLMFDDELKGGYLQYNDSYIYAYFPEYDGGCAVYGAINTLNVVDVITEYTSTDAPVNWEIKINSFAASKEWALSVEEPVSKKIEYVPIEGFLVLKLITHAGYGDGISKITFNFSNGGVAQKSGLDVLDEIYLITKKDGVVLDQPMLAVEDVIFFDPVVSIVVE